MDTPQTLAALLIAAGSLAGAVMLIARQGADGGRTGPLRALTIQGLTLAGLTLASGALLYLTLFPPRLPVGGETLVVATGEAPADLAAAPGERIIALPEAPPIAGAERVPDLATALRRHRQVAALRIEGRGLTERDRDIAAGVPVRFRPMPPPRGLTRLDPPADVPAGSVFTLAGEATGLAGGSVELLDPAGREIDLQALEDGGTFTLGGSARTAGLALFTLRLRDADRTIVAEEPVPVRTLAERPVRALLVGSPSPENKYLRRWAEDSRIDLRSTLDAGGGVDLGDPGVGLSGAQLREADVLVIDDRALQALGSGTRGQVAAAIDRGLGVVVRMSGPAGGPARGAWRSIGLGAEGGTDTQSVALPPAAPDPATLRALRGPEMEDVPPGLNTLEEPPPDLDRWTVRTGPGFVAEVRDADGALLAGWQQRGQGRVALWTVANSYALVLGGRSDLYYQWWSDTVSAVARPDREFRPQTADLPIVGERASVCGLTGSPGVRDPDGTRAKLAIDPAAGPAGCAAWWPTIAGIHSVEQEGEDGTLSFDFAVLPADALDAARKRATGEQTALWAARQEAGEARAGEQREGPAWPWFAAWLVLSAALWLLERRWRANRSPRSPS